MCGFIAVFSHLNFSDLAAKEVLNRLARRGPDGSGEWREEGVYLGHRRLAVIDLDPRSSQPMRSSCGRFVIVFNGEIYNHLELRRSLELRGELFSTDSDTEVLLVLFKVEGERMLSRLKGMFAFVIYDRLEKRAFAARDPYGIKPLYIGDTASGVILGSQVKALLATGLIARAPSERGQLGFFMLGSVPEPYTWYRDIRALPSGHCMWIKGNCVDNLRCWCDISATWRDSSDQVATTLQTRTVKDHVQEALSESVGRHIVADVPIGVFLSGGIDSGAMAGLMRDQGLSNIHGITVTFDEYEGKHWDEAPAAAEIAQHYGLIHHVRKVGREEFLGDLPRILDAMDQPSIDGINTWYASKAVAEQGLKVVVSGVGGDELFLGYNSFTRLPRLVNGLRSVSFLPGFRAIVQMLANAQARHSGNARWRHAPQWLNSMAGAWWLSRSVCAPESLPAELIADSTSVLKDFSPDKWINDMTGQLAGDLTLALAQIESTTYLRNQLLRDSDWASMDHSVELRTPLVDAHLLANLQPLLPQFRSFPGKVLLANAPSRPLPESIIRRKKTGFSIPVKQWQADATGDQLWQNKVASHWRS